MVLGSSPVAVTKHSEMELPTGVMACKVLKNANLSYEKQQLILASYRYRKFPSSRGHNNRQKQNAR